MCPSGWLHGRCSTGIIRGDPLQPQFSLGIIGISLDQWRVSIGLFHCCSFDSSETFIIRCNLMHLVWSLLANLTPIFKWACLVSQQQLESSLCNFQFSLVMFLLLLEAGDIESNPDPVESTISRLVQRLRATGRLTDRPRSGRPRVTTQRQDRRIRLVHLRNRLRTATETAREVIGTHGRRVCPRTVRNRLREFDLRPRRPYVGPNLTPRRRQRRMQWLRAHAPNRFRLADWRRVMFSDESRFSLQRSDRRQRVYRRLGERYSDACIREVDRFGGGGSVMVWGGISYGVKTPLVVIQGNLTAVRYRDQVLMPHVLPLVNAHNLTFQHDNARPHVARVCRDFLNQNNVQVLDWPPYSPDLNPVEHLWDALDRRVRKLVNVPNNVAQLQLALIQEWNNIPQRTIDNLVGSMVRRVRAATAARGGHTRY